MSGVRHINEPPGASIDAVRKKLMRYREHPVTTQETTDNDLNPLIWRLMNYGKEVPDFKYHWFCHRADSTRRDLASFLLRLFAYNDTGNEKVEAWKERLKKVWADCPDCIQCMDDEKTLSDSSFFAAFKKHVLERFWTAFEAFEVQVIIDSVKGKDHLDAETITPCTLYHLLSKTMSFKHPELISLFAKKPFDPPSSGWPSDPPPPGLMLLATHEDEDVRQWALGLLKKSDRNSQKVLNQNHKVALQVLISVLNPSYTEATPLAKEILSVFPFSNTLRDIWIAMTHIIPLIPYQEILLLKLQALVMNHLHDNDEHFRMVLRSFLHIMLKGGSAVWSDEQSDYPLVVFDSIKDNPSYVAIIQGSDGIGPQEEVNPWYLFLPQEMLKSTWESPVFPELAAKVFAFTCDELQHERFSSRRHLISEVGMKTILGCVTRAVKLKASHHYRNLLQIIGIHADFIFAVALSEAHDNERWKNAREAALHLLQVILTSDIDNLAAAMTILSRPEPDTTIEGLKNSLNPTHAQLWAKFYEGVSGKDLNAVTLLLNIAARSARLDTLSTKAVRRSFVSVHETKGGKPSPELLEAVDATVNEVNKSLASTRNGLMSSVSRFTDSQSDLLNLVRQDDVSNYLVYMLLSPIEDYNTAAQTLIGQAYDVDTRSDCLRQLLNSVPRITIQSLTNYLDEFVVHAKKVSEACSLAKALVRAMTDVIEVLGNSPDGLLKDPLFLKSNSKGNWTIQTSLPLLWKAMTASIAVIFKMTPNWAIFYDNKTMVEWMRDALIFGRDLLERRHTFEQASLPYEEQDSSSTKSLRHVRRVMTRGLQDVLYEAQAWLRLTDMELLYQSFALLKSLFQSFHESNEKPSTKTLDKLKKFVDKNRARIGVAEDKLGTFLNPSSLAELDMAIAEFDDEIQIVSIKQKSKSSSPEVEIIEPPKKRKIEKAASRSDKGIGEDEEKKVPVPGKKAHRSREPKFEGGHKSNKPTLPASSSDDSSSEEDEAGKMRPEAKKPVNALASVAEEYRRKEEFLKKAKPERRQIKIIEDPMLTAQKERQRKQLEARRAAFRMKPDISRLHSTILNWNYEHSGDLPPYINERLQLRSLKLQYSSYEEYQKILEPLLMLECWAQIVKSKEEALEEHTYKIVGRSFVDHWLDLDGTSEMNSIGKQEWRLNPETDIVLLRHATEPRCIMAKVTVFRKVSDAVQIGLRCSTKAFPTDPGLHMNSKWRLSLVFSLSTLHREYAALVSLQYHDRLDFVLRPRLSPPITPSSDEISKAMKAYRLNEPQAKAIISSLKKDGFSLIQGPPGTGKTSTICGLVGSFISTRKRAAVPIVPGKPAQKVAVPKVLVCAPSNAAVDEVAKRLMEGIWGSNGQKIMPNVVRVGADRQVNVSVKEISLDYLVEHRLSLISSGEGAEGGNEMSNLVAEMGRVKKLRNEKMDVLKNTINDTAKILVLEREIKDLNSTRMSLSKRFNQLKDIQKSERRNLDAARRECRYEILADADVICCTLSGSGHELLEPFEFPLLIIDEAAQSVELSSLIPLKYQSTKCILVGDPKQLPPTVLSQEAMKWQYDRSFFVRMNENQPDAMHLLSIQYRMHPQISRVPSKIFYDGRLSDGPDMAGKTKQAWHHEERLGVYKFFNASRGKEETSAIGHSQFNREECSAILALYTRLTRQFAGITFDYRIGIISMYKQQIFELRRVFKQRFGPDILEKIDFNTVDGFQGQEKDIIILSCVRAGPSLKSIGFLSDKRRINVAITRCRSSLYIVGNAPSLQRCDETWSAIIEDARSRSCLIDLPDLTYFTAREKLAVTANPQSSITELSSTTITPSEPPAITPDNESDTKSTGKRKRSMNEYLSRKKPLGVTKPSDSMLSADAGSSRDGRTLLERIGPDSHAEGAVEKVAESSAVSQRKAEKSLEMLRQRKKSRNNIFMKK